MATLTVNEKTGQSLTLKSFTLLTAEKEFHRLQSLQYFRMFNDLVPEGTPAESLKYSPLQQFFQTRAQHHAQQCLLIASEIEKLDIAVNSTIFD